MTVDRRRESGAAGDAGAVLRRIGGIAALLVAVMLLVGAFALGAPGPGPGLRNWLVVLFEVNAGTGRLPADALGRLGPIDLVILVSVGIAYLGLWPGPVRPHRFWMVIAVALPFAGILVLLITGESGRSAVMNAGIVVAILMAVGRQWRPATLGLVSNGALLVADFATGDAARAPIAVLIAVGYLLLVAWFVLLGVRMLRRR